MNYSDNDTIDAIYDRIWELSPYHKEPESYDKLTALTALLIEAYQANDRLECDPFLSTATRKVSIQWQKLNVLLENQICLVTGGSGCVGSCLVDQLLSVGIKMLIIFDKKLISEKYIHDKRVVLVNGNVSDEVGLKACFDQYNPNFVFHTAAQRSPGYAEQHILEAIQDNVFGTLNILNVCENTASVKQCVFSSTGKASRYYTAEVYAATKKLCEFLFDTHARNSRVLYSMVRFTHIIDNSLMNDELKNVDDIDYLAIHSPGKYVTAQNVTEAAGLMLNALIYAEKDKSVFLIVKNLEWPVESLEVALYNILKRKNVIPVIFKGNPPGYREKFFRGQLDWSTPQELNLLINVYENQHVKVNTEEDIMISKLLPVDQTLLLQSVEEFKGVDNDAAAANWLKTTLYKCVESSLKYANQADTLNILKWGLDTNYVEPDDDVDFQFKEITQLLSNSLSDPEQHKLHGIKINRPQYEPDIRG